MLWTKPLDRFRRTKSRNRRPNRSLAPRFSASSRLEMETLEARMVLTGPGGMACIGDLVWSDLNANGVQDAGEPGIPGVTVELRDSAGATLESTVTDAAGNYTFVDLPAGDYIVHLDETTFPADFTLTAPNIGADDGADSDFDPVSRDAAITLTDQSGDELHVDAGLVGLGNVFVFKCLDDELDGCDDVIPAVTGQNGQASAVVDTGIPGITVTLTGTDIHGTVVNQVEVTNASGNATFGDLVPSVAGVGPATGYTVTETMPPHFIAIGPTAQTIDLSSARNVFLSFANSPASSIHGFKFTDTNGNGVFDMAELPAENVEFTLTGTDLQGNAVGPLTTMTNAAGEFDFVGLTAGVYTINETLAPGVLQTTGQRPGRLFAVPVDANDDIVELNPVTGVELNRFAAPIATTGTDEGLAFDGTHLWFLNGAASDTLFRLNPETGAIIESTLITAGSGDYDGLATLNGQVYILDRTDNDIHIFAPGLNTVIGTLDIDGVNAGVDILRGLYSLADPDVLVVTNENALEHIEIDPSTGTVIGTIPIGFSPNGAASLAGEIYAENDVFDRTGTMLRSLTLPYTLSAVGADPFRSSTISLRPGDEYVAFPGQAMIDPQDPLDMRTEVLVDSDANGQNEALMFGNVESGSIHGLKFEDVNANGIMDAGESPIEGVLITVSWSPRPPPICRAFNAHDGRWPVLVR